MNAMNHRQDLTILALEYGMIPSIDYFFELNEAQQAVIHRQMQKVASVPDKNRERADELTREITAFPTFSALIVAQGGYRPTLLTKGKNKLAHKCAELADAYDRTQQRRGDERRAYRG